MLVDEAAARSPGGRRTTPKQADPVRRYLGREGYTVAVVHDGRSAIDSARQRRPDLLVTARSPEDDLLLGLDLGADDHLTKPYGPRELVARVPTSLRRAKRKAPAGESGPYRVGELEVDPVRHEVRFGGALVERTTAEFRILARLAAEPGRAFSWAQLLTEALGYDHYALGCTVDVHVMNLRRKIEAQPSKPGYLVTVYGMGYKMAENAGDPPAD